MVGRSVEDWLYPSVPTAITRPPQDVPGLAWALRSSTRDVRIGGVHDRVPDPIALSLLDLRAGSGAAVDLVEKELAAFGIRGLRPLSGGASAVVLKADDGLVVRLTWGEIGERHDVPEMLQALTSGNTHSIGWEVLPFVDTSNITEDDVEAMKGALMERGLSFCDAGTDNLGRLNGQLYVIDPGAVGLDPSPRL